MQNNKDTTLWDFHQDENRNHLKDSYPRQDMISKKIAKFLNKWSKILEIWFWDWYLLNKLSNLWFEVIWQDLSEKNIEITKKQWNNNKITFILWDDSWKFQFDDNSIDWFVASEVLEHMNDEQLNICTSEIYRFLKVWWYAFLSFPARENLKLSECMCPNCSETFHKRWHKQSWTDEKIKDKFKNFEIILLKEFVSRSKWTSLISEFIGYLKYFWSYVLNINKSYLVIIKKKS